MIYDMTNNAKYPNTGELGFAIHSAEDEQHSYYDLYTDDGKGNGDYICQSPDKYWIQRIAEAMDYARFSGYKHTNQGEK